MSIEVTILKNLIYDEDYLRKVLPFIKTEYFADGVEKIIFEQIHGFVETYSRPPTMEAIIHGIVEKRNITETQLDECEQYIDRIIANKEEPTDIEWLIVESEKFCQDKAVYNAVIASIGIIEGTDKDHSKGSIPKLLQDALAVTFDTSVGHDFLEDSDERFDFYHRVEEKIRFDLEFFNKITRGGLNKKTLNIILAPTGVGKSLIMCHFAAGFLVQGQNVLYITLEMSEEMIAQRIDANLLDVTLEELIKLPKSDYDKKVDRIKNKTAGKLIIKEYPTASASVIHFRALINELNLKKNFKPDVIFIDYINIACSSRVKPGASINSYTYVKAIAEEFRGLAVECNAPLVSATQTTRSGSTNTDPGLDDTAESFGLPATADFMFAAITSEELEALGQLMIKQLKNRYNDLNYYKRFAIGINKSKMRLFDVEVSAQQGITDAGSHIPHDSNLSRNKKDFSGFIFTDDE